MPAPRPLGLTASMVWEYTEALRAKAASHTAEPTKPLKPTVKRDEPPSIKIEALAPPDQSFRAGASAAAQQAPSSTLDANELHTMPVTR